MADEVVIAMVMEIHGIEILPSDSGKSMSTALGRVEGFLTLNVSMGQSRYRNNGTIVDPVAIHHEGGCQDFFSYGRDIWRLALPGWLPRIALANVVALPGYLASRLSFHRERMRDRLGKFGVSGIFPERWLRKLRLI